MMAAGLWLLLCCHCFAAAATTAAGHSVSGNRWTSLSRKAHALASGGSLII